MRLRYGQLIATNLDSTPHTFDKPLDSQVVSLAQILPDRRETSLDEDVRCVGGAD
jgi:hypothetical protein